MSETREAKDFMRDFDNLSEDEQKKVIKKLMPKICEIAMKDRSLIQEMMPECMQMMKGMDFSIKR